jgi:predicted dehydrogenase
MKKIIFKLFRLIYNKLGLGIDKLKNYRSLRSFQKQIEVEEAHLKGTIWVVGCGRMGQQFIKAILSSKGLQLGGLIDFHLETLKRVQTQYKLSDVKSGNNLELLEGSFDFSNDVLVIATTADSHFDLVSEAIKRGVKKIFLEKPITTSISDGYKLDALAKDTKTLIYIDHTRRWMSSFIALKNLIHSGIIGSPELCLMPYGEGGVAMIGSHLFDLSRFLFESEIIEVSAQFDKVQKENIRGTQFNDPTGNFIIQLKSGIQVNIFLSNTLTKKPNLITILGTQGRIEIDIENEFIYIRSVSTIEWTRPFPWNIDKQNALTVALSKLLKGETPACTIIDGIKAIEAVVASHESGANSGKKVVLPLDNHLQNKKFSFA